MHRFLSCLLGALLVLPSAASAQDAVKSLPQAYKVQFENPFVRVVRVHYDAGAKLPTHTHGAGTTAYIYLNDSDEIGRAHV